MVHQMNMSAEDAVSIHDASGTPEDEVWISMISQPGRVSIGVSMPMVVMLLRRSAASMSGTDWRCPSDISTIVFGGSPFRRQTTGPEVSPTEGIKIGRRTKRFTTDDLPELNSPATTMRFWGSGCARGGFKGRPRFGAKQHDALGRTFLVARYLNPVQMRSSFKCRHPKDFRRQASQERSRLRRTPLRRRRQGRWIHRRRSDQALRASFLPLRFHASAAV